MVLELMLCEVSQLIIPVVDDEKWEAMHFEWVSPIGQWHRLKVDRSAGGSWAVRAITCGEPEQLLVAAAEKAFGN